MILAYCSSTVHCTSSTLSLFVYIPISMTGNLFVFSNKWHHCQNYANMMQSNGKLLSLYHNPCQYFVFSVCFIWQTWTSWILLLHSSFLYTSVMWVDFKQCEDRFCGVTWVRLFNVFLWKVNMFLTLTKIWVCWQLYLFGVLFHFQHLNSNSVPGCLTSNNKFLLEVTDY